MLDLNQQVISCENCPLVYTEGYVPGIGVPGEGTANPDFFVIGEAPGADEAVFGYPFVGKSGELLRRSMHAIGMHRGNTYWTNVVKHRPPNNRQPLPTEISICSELFLNKELEHYKPQIIITLGRTATEFMLKKAKLPIPEGSVRGQRFFYKETRVISTWHPAYILRVPEKKPELLEDLQAAYASIKDTTDEQNNTSSTPA